MQSLIDPNHRPSAGQKLQQRRIWMRLDRFVQQERLLAGGDQFAISNLPTCHINMYRRVSLFSCIRGLRIKDGPAVVNVEPRCIVGQIHVLAASRHRVLIRRDPSWSGLMSTLVPLALDFPTLRLRFQFVSGRDEHDAPAARKKIFQSSAKLVSGRGLCPSYVRKITRKAADKERCCSDCVLIEERVLILTALHLVSSAR